MGLGLSELLLVVAVSIASLVEAGRSGRRWIGLMPLVFLSVALLTPADPMSTLLIALPNVVLMCLAVRMAGPADSRKATTSA